MAKYSDIKGFTVQTLSTDTVASQAAGGSWASGGSMPAAKYVGLSAGTQTSNVIAGGATDPPANSNQVNTTFEYDGSSWTAGGALNTTRFAGAGFGATNTAAIMVGGAASPGSATQPAVESYNGTSFTEVAEANTARGETFGGAGTSTAGVIYGGRNPGLSPATRGETENWNGSAWTETSDLNTARAEIAAAGESYTAAIAAGGYTTTAVANVETWNGSSWTEVSDINTAKYNSGASGGSPSSIIFGGLIQPGTVKSETESWDGTSWTEVADLSSGRWGPGKSSYGTSASALCSGGNTGSEAVTSTEEWTAPAVFNQIQEGQLFYNSTANAFKETIQDVSGAAWASITASNTPRFGLGGAGTQTEALIFSGAGGSPVANRPQTEHWNGSSWTELNDLNLGRYHSAKTSFGTVYTAALAATGYTYVSPAQNIANVETWDGTSWTEVNDVNSARRGAGAGGTSTSGIIGGGYTTTITNLAETWNGSSWTEVSELNTGREDTGGVGTSSSDMQMHGGYTGSQSGATEQWNGTSWTEVNDMNTARSGAAGSGIPSLAIAVGGEPGNSAKTEFWNGSSWTEVGDLGTARTKSGSSATSALASILVAGSAPPFSAAAEEWTVNLANKTITST